MKNIVLVKSYNNESTIKNVLEAYSYYFDKIYVVDLGSTDNTIQIAKSCGVSVIVQAAVNELFKHEDIDYIIITDATNSYNAYDSYLLLYYISSHKNYDLVIGNRFDLNINAYNCYEKFINHIASKKLNKSIIDILSNSFVVTKDLFLNSLLHTNYWNIECTKTSTNNTYIDISYIDKKSNTIRQLFTILKLIRERKT